MSDEKRLQQIRYAARYKYPDERIHFIDGAKWADSHPHWIPIEEELPKKDGKYLFYDEVLGHEVSIYYDGVTLVPSITHWMPLPEAPQGKEDEI